jgi:hypothetical protein
MRLNYNSPHFHALSKGCVVKPKDIRSFTRVGSEKYRMRAEYCETHRVAICRCGWEFGWHYDIKELDLKTAGEIQSEKELKEMEDNDQFN